MKMQEQSQLARRSTILDYVGEMVGYLERRREFEGAGKNSPQHKEMKALAEELVRADRSKRMKFSKIEALKSICPGCANPLGDFPYHLKDGRVLCNSCGVEALQGTRPRPVRY